VGQAAGGYLSLFVRLSGSPYRIRSRSYVVFLLLPVHFRLPFGLIFTVSAPFAFGLVRLTVDEL